MAMQWALGSAVVGSVSLCWYCIRGVVREGQADVPPEQLEGMDHPSPGVSAIRDLPRITSLDTSEWKSCLDREFVQKELGWARKYNKKIIVVVEKEERRPGFFDYTTAWAKYKGSEWEFILDISAITYQRELFQISGMVAEILATAGALLEPRVDPGAQCINPPGHWDFFISHGQVGGGDQCANLHLRLQEAGKTAWYDNAMLNKSTKAMEEGVQGCGVVLLFLTADPPTPTPPSTPVATASGAVVSPHVVPLTRRQSEPALASHADEGPGKMTTSISTPTLRRTSSVGKVTLKRNRDFSERVHLQAELTQWATHAYGEDGCLVIGGPGAGKTTLLTELLQPGGEFQQTVLMTHFCAHESPESLKPATFVRLVLGQLQIYPWFPGENMSQDFHARMGKVLAIDDTGMGDQLGDAFGNFVDFVLTPLKVAYPRADGPDEGHVLVVDSLDEALLVSSSEIFDNRQASRECSSIVKMLAVAHAKGMFPAWLKVLATTRDVAEVNTSMRSWRRIELSDAAHVAESTRDIRKYINNRLATVGSRLSKLADESPPSLTSPASLDNDGFRYDCAEHAWPYLEALARRSTGNFLWAFTAIHDIESGNSKLADTAALPRKQEDLNLHFFERHFGSSDSDTYQSVLPVFEVIEASENGVLTELMLLQCLRVCDPDAGKKVLEARLQSVSQFLKKVTESHPPRLAFHHLSFGQWLKNGKHEFAIDASRGHRALAVVFFAFMASNTHDIADEFARVAVDQLDCHASLKAKHIRLVHNEMKRAPSVVLEHGVYSLVRHMAVAATENGACVKTIGDLFRRGGVDVESRSTDGVLRCACRAAADGETNALDLLAAAGAELTKANVDDPHVSAPLLFAAQNGHVDTIRLLIDHENRAHDLQHPEPQHIDVRGRRVLNLQGRSPLTNDQGWTALHCAAFGGHVEAMQLLIKARSEGGSGQYVGTQALNGQRALHFAAQGGHVEAIGLLVDMHAELDAMDEEGATALHSAATWGRTGVITELIRLGADVEAQDSFGCTGLHFAAQAGHVATIDLLKQEGCDVNAQMYKMKGNQQSLWTPLHLAVFNGHMDALRQLLTAGVDVKITDSEGSTALHYASTVRALVTQGGIELLVEAGAKVNAQGEDGSTALHYAADLGHEDALRRLLHVGADPTIVAFDESGSDVTAYDCAIIAGHDECALLLERLWGD